jgi:hypothetical protein
MFDSPAAPFSPEFASPSIEVAAEFAPAFADANALFAFPGFAGSSEALGRLRRALHAVRSAPRVRCS